MSTSERLKRNEQNNSSMVIQPQLEVGARDDRYEREADTMADKVMRMSDGPEIQRMHQEDEDKIMTMSDGLEVQRMHEEDEDKKVTMSDGPEIQAMHDGSESGLIAPASLEAGIGNSKGSGHPLPAEIQAEMENKIGADLSSVRIHTDDSAALMNKDINAKAFTHGQDIYFSHGQYNPASAQGKMLLAHELTHTVQQGKGVQRKIMRAVNTLGGTFNTTTYAPYTAAWNGRKVVGATINLKFTPNDLVVADNIGLTQTVKTMKNTVAGGMVNTPSYTNPTNEATSLKSGDKGRSVDRIDYVYQLQGGNLVSTGMPETNPIYAVHNTRMLNANGAIVPGSDRVSTSLADINTVPTWGAHGSHKKAGNTFLPAVDAQLIDEPKRLVEFKGQMYEQSFEVAAIVLDGPMKNTYLGTVAWGWKSDAAGIPSLDPGSLKLVSTGVPSKNFLEAAKLWNSTTFKDTKIPNKTYDSVDLPITTNSSGSKLPSDMKTSEIVESLTQIAQQLPSLSGVNKTNREFEKRALEAELSTRNIKISVTVNSTEDWTGNDEVYVKATSGELSVTTKEKSIGEKSSREFWINLSALLPLGKNIMIEVYDADTPDPDDLIVVMDWKHPFYEGIINASSRDGANYSITLNTGK
jgi:hypothetical protein